MRVISGDPRRVATILPGKGYTASAPLLYYATMLLTARGWTVRQVSWSGVDRIGPEEAAAQARHELDAVSAPLHLVVAKSLGTFSLPDAMERHLPGVWLTPILTEPTIAAALSTIAAPTLLVGGTADPYWVSDVARRSGADDLEIPEGDHSLEVGSAIEPALAVVRLVMDRMSSFLDSIPNNSE